MAIDSELLPLEGARLLTPRRFADARGFFTETYSKSRYQRAGVDVDFVQDNHSYSARAGTLRGLHFQAPPHAQAKLVSVIRGAVRDVLVDARRASATFARWVSVDLSEQNGQQVFVPAGFLHGFITLVPDTHVVYKVDSYYHAASEGSIAWDDPDLAIGWRLDGLVPTLSDKDEHGMRWAEWDTPF